LWEKFCKVNFEILTKSSHRIVFNYTKGIKRRNFIFSVECRPTCVILHFGVDTRAIQPSTGDTALAVYTDSTSGYDEFSKLLSDFGEVVDVAGGAKCVVLPGADTDCVPYAGGDTVELTELRPVADPGTVSGTGDPYMEQGGSGSGSDNVWRPFKHVSDEMLGAGMEPMVVEEVAGDVGGAACRFVSGADNDAAPAEGGRGGGEDTKSHKRNPSRVRFAK
jgi:hypothetical protein